LLLYPVLTTGYNGSGNYAGPAFASPKGLKMKRKNNTIPRILITLLGVCLILVGMSGILLGFAGRSAQAAVTHIRREGGERTDGKPGRYTYIISYTFTLPDGKEIDGFSRKIGDSVYLKADGTSAVRVRYFSVFPYINAMERDTGFGAGQVIFIAAGSFLIFFMNRKPAALSDKDKRKAGGDRKDKKR